LHNENNREQYAKQTCSWALGTDLKKGGLTTARKALDTISHPCLDAFGETLKTFEAEDLDGFTSQKPMPRIAYYEEAEEIDCERIYSDPDLCMFQFERDETVDSLSAGFIDIVAEIGATGQYENHEIQNAGLAACALADGLENMGYRTRIVGFNRSEGVDPAEGKYLTFSFTAKEYDEPLDVGRVGWMIGTGAFYRCNVFCAKTMVCHGEVDYGLGASVSTPKSVVAKMPFDVSEHFIFCPRMTRKDRAIEFVKDMIEETKAKATQVVA
jgi:hypothetical protein